MCVVDEYMTQVLVQQRLEEARAFAEREVLFAEFRTPWRVAIGRSLVRLGQRVAGTGAAAPSRVQPSLS